PIEAEVANQRPGVYVIDLTKLEDGTYTMVASSILNRTLVDLIKRGTADANKLNEISINVYPNPSTGVFIVEADNNAKITVLDNTMQPIDASVQNLLNNEHRIDITQHVGGLYFVQVITKEGMATKQLFKR
ncbi:MAG: T9SS type A sorting domain-containing protein, partial [Flavobacteriales bacterium]|nr:T9SS type A sorting domain-containing protein [Flavobacteriales bacterium]